MAKKNMPANDSRTLDETIQDKVDTQDLNLYNLFQETHFKINDSRKKNKFQKDDKILKGLTIEFFKILENSPNHNKEEIEEISRRISVILRNRNRDKKYTSKRKQLENSENPDKKFFNLLKSNKENQKI